MKVVVYFRRNADPEETESELAVQRGAVAAWLSENERTVVAEFVEVETGGNNRPNFGAALKAAKAQDAAVLVATTRPLAGGRRFAPWDPYEGPRIICLEDPDEAAHASPAPEEAPADAGSRQETRWPETIEVADAATPIGLLFGDDRVRNAVPVYLANATGSGLSGVVVSSIGWTLFDSRIVETTPSVKQLGAIPNGTGRLLEGYDLFFDADFVVSYRITAMAEETRFEGTTSADKGPPRSRWAPVKDWNPTG